MPRAASSPARSSSIAAPSRISSSAVAGLATGIRIRAGQRRMRCHRGASFQRWTRYGLSSSNSRACRSTRSSAWSVETERFSMMKLPLARSRSGRVPPRVLSSDGSGFRAAIDHVVDHACPDVVREGEDGDRVGHLERRRRRRRHVAAEPQSVLARSASRAASAASSSTVSAVPGASIERHASARVSEPAWNSESRRKVFTSSGDGSMIRSNP